MSFSRHDSGMGADLRALGSQVHPVFMLPPLAASVFGATLATRDLSVPLAGLHLVAVFCALYTAHVKDGYVDFYARGEDDDHPLSERGCERALLLASVGFFLATIAIGLLVGPLAALLCLPGWLIGYFHAPQLDTNLLGATLGYPAGIAFALLGGHYVQTGTLTPIVLAFAVVFLVTLAGIKVVDDAKDYAYDSSIGKNTVAVVLGRERAHLVAYGLMGAGMLAVVAGALAGVFPRGAAFAPVAFGAVAVIAYTRDAKTATMLLVRGSYLFLAVLVFAAWFRPLA
ncbi:UbiA family prenyltransferase [Natronomonas sp. EA1]|uniref:UbiA family prenyltransferase n=1 Tax=Natronomonas sp. EA1 TaxID=3421655 RepID=UPI003EB9E701